MKRRNEPDGMHLILVVIVMLLTAAYMYKCWQVAQLIRMMLA